MNNLEASIILTGSKYGLVVTNEIGLMGHLFKGIDLYEDCNTGRDVDKVFDNYKPSNIDKKGDYFTVLGQDGLELFPEYIVESGIMIDASNNILGYCFKLKDYKAIDEISDFIGMEEEVPGVILYIDNKLYCNNIKNKEILNKYTLQKGISFGWGLMRIGNNTYEKQLLNDNNRIYIYKKVGTHDR